MCFAYQERNSEVLILSYIYIYIYMTFRVFALMHSLEYCEPSTSISALIDMSSTELRNPLIQLRHAN